MSDHITFPEPSTSAQEDGFLTAENMAATSFQAQLEAPIVRKASKPIPKGGNTITSFDGNTDNKEEEGVEGDAAPVEAMAPNTKSSPKKRATAPTGEDDTSPKKKRAPAKGKAATEQNAETPAKKRGRPAKAKPTGTEQNEDEAAKTSENDNAVDTMTERPSTPESQTIREPKTPKTPKTPRSPNIVAANENTPKAGRVKAQPSKTTPKVSPVKGKRQVAEKVAEKVQLPTKWSEASLADRTLVAMKEAGKSWSEIRTKWFEMTGQETAASTLPNRYKRLLVIKMEMQDDEKETLLAAKEAVESNMKNTLWNAIANKMAEMGTKKYPSEFLQKEYKKLETSGFSSSSNGNNKTNGGAVATTSYTTPGGVYGPTAMLAASGTKGKAVAANGNSRANKEAAAVEGANVLLAAAAEAFAAAGSDDDDETEEEGEEEEEEGEVKEEVKEEEGEGGQEEEAE